MPDKPQPKRKLIDLDVEFISLVSAPANGKPLVLKGAGTGRARTFTLKAGPDELMRAYGIVYAPGEVDTHGDTADAPTILRAANAFMRLKRVDQVDREHSFRAEQAFVAESWILRQGDPLFPGDPPGAWAVGIQVGDPQLWAQLKAGELTGLSLAGMAQTQELEGDGPVTKGWLTALFQRLTKQEQEQEERQMTEDDVRRIAGEAAKAAVTEALKAAGVGQSGQPGQAGGEPPAAVTKADLEALEGKLGETIKAQLAEALKKGAGEGGPAGGSDLDQAWGLL